MEQETPDLPLAGIRVLDLAQYLSGPGAALRLADLGATVTKVEPPNGDNCRRLKFRDLELGGTSALFQTINRGKGSVAANLKDEADLEAVKELVKHADVLVQNFRPGTIERLGLGYDVVSEINPQIIYATVTGYGPALEWETFPGQDLLAQSVMGIPYLNGSAESSPIAVGTSIADMSAAGHLVQGILAGLVRRARTGRGGRVDVSLMESVLDLAFESFTHYLNIGTAPVRGPKDGAHPDIAAPYGIYETANGYIALSMIPVPKLAELLEVDGLETYTGPGDAFEHRPDIVGLVGHRLRENTTEHWLEILRNADAWCAPVLSWPELSQQEAFSQASLVQTVNLDDGTTMQTTRCPIRIDGRILNSDVPAPELGPRVTDLDASHAN